MSEIKNGGLDQYGAEPFEQQQFRASGVEAVSVMNRCANTKIWFVMAVYRQASFLHSFVTLTSMI